jgi:hypothetical protein
MPNRTPGCDSLGHVGIGDNFSPEAVVMVDPSFLLVFVSSFLGNPSDLIERLGDDRYFVREVAQAQLEQDIISTKSYSIWSLIKAALDNEDPEIARRAKTILKSYYNVTLTNYSVNPWIDMMPLSYPGRQIMMESCLAEVRGNYSTGWGYGNDWPEYRSATAIMVKRLLDQGYSRHCVRQLLDDMVENEIQYREKNGMKLIASR